MAGATLSHELRIYIQSLYNQGILDRNFDRVQSFQNEETPHFVMEILAIFCHDADDMINQVTSFLDSPTVNFLKVVNVARQLNGSSGSIGGVRMSQASGDLRKAGDSRDKERCVEAFERVKHEYNTLRECLNTICRLERHILANQTRRRRRQP